MKEDYPLAFLLTQAVSRMSCAVQRVFTRRREFVTRGGGYQKCKTSIRNFLQRFKAKRRCVVTGRRTRLRWPTVPIVVFLAGTLLAPVSVYAQTVVEIAGNVTQKENQTTFTFTIQGAGGAAINGTVRYVIEGVTSPAHPNSG